MNQSEKSTTSSVMSAIKSVAYSKHTRGNLFNAVSPLPVFFVCQ